MTPDDTADTVRTADLLRAQLHAARDAVPAPAAGALADAALRRSRGIRTRRRATWAGVALAGVAAVAMVAPGVGPSPIPGPAATGPTATLPPASTGGPVSPTPAPSPTWRVTERCDASRFLCQDLPVDALEVDGATYRVRTSGAQPWGARGHAIQLSVGQRGAVHQVLAGVVRRGGRSGDLAVRASFDVYVDGRRARRYQDAPLSLLHLRAGRHQVKVVALGDPVPGTSVVIGDFAPFP